MHVTLRRVRVNHCCRGKTVCITYSERVSIALGIQQAMRVRHTVMCGLPVPTIFFDVTSHAAQSSCGGGYYYYYYYYSVVCLTTGPKPLPKRFLHIVRSKASSFK